MRASDIDGCMPTAATAETATNKGALLLGAYLKEHGLSYTDAAKLFECARSYVSHLVKCRATPGMSFAARIEEATGGEIPCISWRQEP